MTVIDPPLNSSVSRAVTVAGLAEMFVETRRVVPGLTIGTDGVARSWWWPLPSATDRGLLAALLDGNDGPPLLMISLKAGGTGLNLASASHGLHYDNCVMR